MSSSTSPTSSVRFSRSSWVASLIGALIAGLPTAAEAQAVLSSFEGSVERGEYVADFDVLAYPLTLGFAPEVDRVEGALVSRVFTKPTEKSNLEVFRSYESELRSAGFSIQLSAEQGNDTELAVRAVYADHVPGFLSRAYRATGGQVGRGELGRVGTQAAYYLLASRASGEGTLWVAVVLSRYDDLYMIEELTVADMETGTVTLDLDQMRSALDANGKIAIYDIHFATGSAVIESSSADALAVIAAYLEEASGTYYIVGHTDDTGTLASNLALAEARAAAVREALITDHGIAAARLEARGVGPLAPVSTNAGEAGRALNRRVEIVQRLAGG